MVIPADNAQEAAVVESVPIYGMQTLPQVVEFLTGSAPSQPVQIDVQGRLRDLLRIPGGFFGSKRAGARQAGDRSGGRGQPQHHHDRTSRLGQDHAGPAASLRASADELRRVHRDHQDPQHHGAAQKRPAPHRDAALPLAASHHLRCGPDRRRAGAEAGRGEPVAQRRPVPRRAARVQAQRARSAPPAARGRTGHDLARRHVAHLSRVAHAGCRHEPLQVRLPRRPVPSVPLLAPPDPDLPLESVRPAHGPDRYPYRGAGHQVQRDLLGRAGRAVRRHPRTGHPGAQRCSRSGSRATASTPTPT